MAARFLVLEGVDGSGKTTQAERLLSWPLMAAWSGQQRPAKRMSSI